MSVIITEKTFISKGSKKMDKKKWEVKEGFVFVLIIISIIAFGLCSPVLSDHFTSLFLKVIYSTGCATPFLIGLYLGLKNASQLCHSCKKFFETGDQVIELFGRNPGNFSAYHKECYKKGKAKEVKAF